MTNIVNTIAQFISQNRSKIDMWFEAEFSKTPPPIYSSVDIRNSGAKLAPVDTNLFPAGFNNLSFEEIELAQNEFTKFIKTHYPNSKTIFLIPESNSRNQTYADNIKIISKILSSKDVNVTIINPESFTNQDFSMNDTNNQKIEMENAIIKNQKLQTNSGKIADLIINNHDGTGGTLDFLQHITQPILPNNQFGWQNRSKTQHFTSYDKIIQDFANNFEEFPLATSLISTLYHNCGQINFKEQKGLDCIAIGIDKVIYKINQQNNKLKLNSTPYCFIKSDQGTYGMGIMTATKGEEIYEINKKIRNKMNVIKSGAKNTKVIIQEGIETIDKINNHSAEPLIYLIAGKPISCFFRVNSHKNSLSNLNSKGMHFEKINFYDMIKNETPYYEACAFIAKLATLAAAREFE